MYFNCAEKEGGGQEFVPKLSDYTHEGIYRIQDRVLKHSCKSKYLKIKELKVFVE